MADAKGSQSVCVSITRNARSAHPHPHVGQPCKQPTLRGSALYTPSTSVQMLMCPLRKSAPNVVALRSLPLRFSVVALPCNPHGEYGSLPHGCNFCSKVAISWHMAGQEVTSPVPLANLADCLARSFVWSSPSTQTQKLSQANHPSSLLQLHCCAA